MILNNLSLVTLKVFIHFSRTLLTGADLTLVYGRRYGMVGRNGIGKSTLLRMVSR